MKRHPYLGLVDLAMTGNWGEFVQHNNPLPWERECCPFCGCTSYIAFCFESVEVPGSSGMYLSNPDDAFECIECGAVHTRSSDTWGGYTDEEKAALLAAKHIVRVGKEVYEV